MDIHKPKPWHGLREFLKEIGTIVIGVLIALGAEQTVETVHRAQEVREARDALRREISTNVAIARLWIEQNKCLRPQLDAVQAWALGASKPPSFRVFPLGTLTTTWDTVEASAVPHMPLHERLAMADLYDHLNTEEIAISGSRTTNMSIHGLLNRPKLDAESAGRVLEIVGQERRFAEVNDGNAETTIRKAAALGIAASPVAREDRISLDWVCGRVRQ